MKLRTRLDLFSAALLSALGASSVVACGGSAFTETANGSGGTGNTGAGGNNNAAGSHSAGTGGTVAIAGSAGTSHVAGASNGGSSNGGSSNGGSSNNGGATNHFPCKNPKDIGNGVIECDGFSHRPTSGECQSKLPRATPYPNPPVGATCKADSDCTEKPHGWCGQGSGGQIPGPYCNYGCVKDSECAAEQLCLCGDPVGRCVGASGCSTDAACPAGFLCKSYDVTRGCQFTSFTCQNPADECGSDADCAANAAGNLCSYDTDLKHFRCEPGGCAIGRPFLVEGEQRLACAARRSDWNELALLPRLEALAPEVTAHLAQQWTRVALMEHASIAAFARFTLQLMSLGAPPDLIERSTSAMADETKHAKACFALASSYALQPVGPGRLVVESSLDEMSLEAIVLNTIREGCIGETVAAVEAREAAEHAVDPALRALLLTISEDETRHAELAFRFVKWALAAGDVRLERAVRREFDALSLEVAPHTQPLSTLEIEALRNGIVPEALRQTVRTRAINEIILPCSRALYPSADQPTRAAFEHAQALGGSST